MPRAAFSACSRPMPPTLMRYLAYGPGDSDDASWAGVACANCAGATARWRTMRRAAFSACSRRMPPTLLMHLGYGPVKLDDASREGQAIGEARTASRAGGGWR